MLRRFISNEIAPLTVCVRYIHENYLSTLHV